VAGSESCEGTYSRFGPVVSVSGVATLAWRPGGSLVQSVTL